MFQINKIQMLGRSADRNDKNFGLKDVKISCLFVLAVCIIVSQNINIHFVIHERIFCNGNKLFTTSKFSGFRQNNWIQILRCSSLIKKILMIPSLFWLKSFLLTLCKICLKLSILTNRMIKRSHISTSIFITKNSFSKIQLRAQSFSNRLKSVKCNWIWSIRSICKSMILKNKRSTVF